jgi:hypothetical protein
MFDFLIDRNLSISLLVQLSWKASPWSITVSVPSWQAGEMIKSFRWPIVQSLHQQHQQLAEAGQEVEIPLPPGLDRSE